MFDFRKWLNKTYEQCSKDNKMSKLQFTLLIGEPYTRTLRIMNGKHVVGSFHIMQRYVNGIVRAFPNVERPF